MSFEGNLNGYYDVANQLPQFLERKAIEYFEAEDRIKKSIKSVEEFEERRKGLREFFIDSIGGIDFERTPLYDVCTGTIEKDSYRIKKIIFQSQPGVYVTSNLYIPRNIPGNAPAVLFASGHDEASKASPLYQRVCIDLVLNGFIVLSVDPISQGERMQYYDCEAEMNLVRWHGEHTYFGMQCEIAGSSVIRYFIWDLIRAMDYLCSIPEVDTSRIGMTGNSGGAFQTTYMMMVDERLKAAVPCTYITSREEYMRMGAKLDGEEISYGAISKGLNHDDFITCFAPKPVMIGAVESDYFVIEGTIKTFERAKHVYSLFDCEEKVSLGIAKGTHAYNDELRQLAVNWFIENLKGEPGCFVTDPGTPVESARTLQCTASGQVLIEFADAKPIFNLNIEYYKAHKYTYTQDRREVRRRLEKVLNLPREKGEIHARVLSTSRVDNSTKLTDDLNHSELFFFSETGIAVAGIYVDVAGRSAGKCTILIMDEGVNYIHKENDLVNKLLRQGDVLAFEPRGMGVVKSWQDGMTPYYEMGGAEYKANYNSMMMEMPLAGQRVFDILRACEAVRHSRPGMRIGVAGIGFSAIYALFAAVLSDEIDTVYLENMLPSYESLVCTKYYCYDVRYSLYGMLKELDIPMLLEAIKDKDVTCYNRPNVGNIKRW